MQAAHTWLSSSSSEIHPLALEAAKALGSSQARRPPSEMNTLCGMLASAKRTQALHGDPPSSISEACIHPACQQRMPQHLKSGDKHINQYVLHHGDRNSNRLHFYSPWKGCSNL